MTPEQQKTLLDKLERNRQRLDLGVANPHVREIIIRELDRRALLLRMA